MPSTSFHTGVSLRGFYFEDFILTFNLPSTVTAADIGKAVALDASGNAKVKLAGDGDFIIGRLDTVEKREIEGTNTGAVSLKFSNLLPIKSGSGVVRGDTVVGAGNGEVKPATDDDARINFVSEIVGAYAVVTKL